jgi:hypothetical protein
MDRIMTPKMNEMPNENPIKSVLLVLGFLSFIATFSLAGFLNEPLYIFKVTIAVGVICGIIALPLGFKLTNIRLIIRRNPNLVAI